MVLPWYSDRVTLTQVTKAHLSQKRRACLLPAPEAPSLETLPTSSKSPIVSLKLASQPASCPGTLTVGLLGVPALSLSRGLAEWVTSLSWPVGHYYDSCTRLGNLNSGSGQRVFKFSRRPIESRQRKQPVSCLATKKNIEIFLVQVLYRLVCTAQSAHHEGCCRGFLHLCINIVCNSFFFNWKFNLY